MYDGGSNGGLDVVNLTAHEVSAFYSNAMNAHNIIS